MRKEVRLGAAIGGVLIAVLVVYGIVASRGHGKKKEAVVLDTAKTSPTGDPSGGTDRSTPADPAAATDRSIQTGANPADAGTLASTGGAAPGAAAAHPDDSAASPGDAAPPSRSGNNWAALLKADNVEDLMPARTRTPEPASLVPDAGTAGNVIATPEARAIHTAPLDEATGASTASPAAGLSASTQSHTIRSGDTFSSIAREVYGDSRYFKDIARVNPKVDSSHLKVGMVIVLPDRTQLRQNSRASTGVASASDVRPRPAAAALPAVNSKTEYRVESSDSLYKISIKLYHTPNKVDAIYQMNKTSIGADPAKLKLNMVLKLPEAPVSR